MKPRRLFRVVVHLVTGIGVILAGLAPATALRAAPKSTWPDEPVPAAVAEPTAGAYDFMPYGFTSAYDQGLVYSGGIVPGFQDGVRFCPQCYDPNYFRRLSGFSTVSDEVLANALQRADIAVASGMGALNMMSNGGNWNQYAGGWPISGGWSANPNQGIHHNPTGIDIQAPFLSFVLGYNSSSSPYNIGSAYLHQYNQWTNPWANIHLWQSGVWTAGANQEEVADPPAFYQDLHDLAQVQEASIYSDPALKALRTEAYEQLFYFVFRDPYYVYWYYRQQMNLAQFQSLYAYLPSYSLYVTYSQEISSWANSPIPEDAETLAERYWIRYVHAWLEEQLKAEISQFVMQYPDLQQWVSNMQIINNWLAARLEFHYQSQQAQDWYADWQQRWQDALVQAANRPTVLQKAEQLDAAYPGLAEYSQLNREVGELIPQFRDHPAVVELTQKTVAVLEDKATNAAVAEHYRTYLDAVNNWTTHVSFVAAKERHREQLELLVLAAIADADYQQKAQQFNQDANSFITDVYNAVAYCYFYYGNVCDNALYQDANLIAALQSLYENDNFNSVMHSMAAFYEFYYAYWHAFYRGPQYLALEAETLQHMASALASIQGELVAMRAVFHHSVDSIPAVQEIKEARNDLVATLIDASASEVDVEIATQYAAHSAALSEKLERMASLAAEIEDRAPGTDDPPPDDPPSDEPPPQTAVNAVYLPALAR